MPSPLSVRVAAVGALMALATACGDVAPMQNDDTFALGTAAAKQKPWVPTPEEPVTVTMDVPGTVAYGKPMPIRITLHNGTTRPIAVGLGQVQAYDVLVAQIGMRPDSGGVWSPPRMQQMSLEATLTDPLPAGRDTTFQVTWPGTDDTGRFVRRGRYRVRARVMAQLLRTKQLWTPWVPIEVR
ncbi:hypothetical protein J421_0518 [Gemmatirosa kalamazoonensis]|uniref:Intracellular proteinase inhibitor BsuPI domain-containing protein n=1 Tax=Gemmatirosa kalamazoonensis TaxID=861299 RepID=W0RCK9_9BACT|nr:hypothetical protein [Gemmatirosa kalamazoonensis]AHG88055.1 hypothetical protein J421_0518 [Gemmatirosa kalamazoonensis]